MQDNLKIIVKVGTDVSKLKITNCKLYRGITTEEISNLIKTRDDYNLMIVENIEKSEETEMKNIISYFCEKDAKNNVIFFLPDNDATTAGIADELDKNIYMSLKDLHSIINEKYKINVSTFMDDKKELNASELTDIIPEDMTDVFGNIESEEIEEADKAEQEAISADAELIVTEDKKEFEQIIADDINEGSLKELIENSGDDIFGTSIDIEESNVNVGETTITEEVTDEKQI